MISTGESGVTMWEYKFEVFKNSSSPETITNILNRRGADRWELVGFDTKERAAVFKRPTPPSRHGSPEHPYDADET
jgi:hypothetical protein